MVLVPYLVSGVLSRVLGRGGGLGWCWVLQGSFLPVGTAGHGLGNGFEVAGG
jgi:hypothetical protein